MKVNPWLAARKRSGKALKDVEIDLRIAYQDDPQMWLAFDRLQRFETGGSAKIPVEVLAALAQVYGTRISKIDLEAAKLFETHRSHIMQLPGCVPA